MWPTPLTCRRRTSCGWSSRSRRLARPWRVVLRQPAEAPPTVADPSVSASPATEKPDIEMVDLSMAELPEEAEDPVEKNAREQSLEQLDHVHLFNDKSLLFDAMRQKMSLSSKFGVLIDAQTSRLKINLDYMEAVRDFLAATAVGRYSVCVVIGHRTD